MSTNANFIFVTKIQLRSVLNYRHPLFAPFFEKVCPKPAIRIITDLVRVIQAIPPAVFFYQSLQPQNSANFIVSTEPKKLQAENESPLLVYSSSSPPPLIRNIQELAIPIIVDKEKSIIIPCI